MSQPTRSGSRHGEVLLAVDRVRCRAHGICAHVLPGKVALDEWGYPILLDARLTEAEFKTASTLCPALALYRR